MEKLNAELCNTLGNLLNRVTGKNLNPLQNFPIPSTESFRQFDNPHLDSLVGSLNALPTDVDNAFVSLRIDRGIDSIMSCLREANQFIQAARPWKMDASTEADKIKIVLYAAMETIRVCGVLLQPIVPGLAGNMLDVIGVDNGHRNWILLRDDLRPFYHVLPREKRSELFVHSLADVPLKYTDRLPLYPRLKI